MTLHGIMVMARFKTYAVVCEETGVVISQFLEDIMFGQQLKRNGLTMAIMENDQYKETKKVFLSSTKKHIDGIASPLEPQRSILNEAEFPKADLIQIFH